MKLVWSPYALSDRDAIFSHIEADSPRAAVRRLTEFPESGRPGRVAGTRELVVLRTPYVAAYVVLPGMVRILRVLHGAQIWPDDVAKSAPPA